MIVVAIIGILASVAVPSYMTYTVRARMVDVIENCGASARITLAEFHTDYGFMPGSSFGTVSSSNYEAEVFNQLINTCRESKYVGGAVSAVTGGSTGSWFTSDTSTKVVWTPQRSLDGAVIYGVDVTLAVAGGTRPSGATTEVISTAIAGQKIGFSVIPRVTNGANPSISTYESLCGYQADLKSNTQTTVPGKYLPSACR